MTVNDVTTYPMNAPSVVAQSPRDFDRFDELTAFRRRVDDFDRTIIEALRARAAVSRKAQAARISQGGTRVDLTREKQIIASYRREFGADGVELATAILRTCRGHVTD